LGCGSGGNLAMLADFGDLVAVEPHDGARNRAIARGLGRVLAGRLPDQVPLGPESFDAVVMLDVLEHVADDAAALATACRLLAPGGRLLLTVPAFPFLWSRHDELTHHFRRYRRPQLRRLLDENGFAVERLTHFNSLLFPAIATVRLMQRLKRDPSGEDTGMAVPQAAINGALKAILAAEAMALSAMDLPFGVSLLAVARRRKRRA
jgi:SAM-dependent methyltransferase